MKFELWVIDERGTLSKPSDAGDHGGFQLHHSVKGWALIGQNVIVLFRTDQSEPSPDQIRKYYTRRFPRYRIEDRYELSHPCAKDLRPMQRYMPLRKKSLFSPHISAERRSHE